MPTRKPVHSSELVREFHIAFGHPVEQVPTLSTLDTRLLRVKLIAEELAELAQALQISIDVEVKPAIPKDMVEAPKDVSNHMRKWVKVEPTNHDQLMRYNLDLVETADALGDLDYVVQGGFLAFGLPASQITQEIHRSNMTKLGADGKPILAPDGKVVKGPNFQEPRIADVIARPKVA